MKRLNENDINSLSKVERAAITRLKVLLKKEFSVMKLILFGSKARGDGTEYSDVDLMVLMSEPKSPEIRKRLSDLQFEVIMEQDAPLMTIMENYDNWVNERNISLPLKDNIESEGIEIEI